MKKPLLCLFDSIQWLKYGISMNEILLFGVRVRRVFIVLRVLNGRYDHEEQPGTVQQNDLQQRKDHPKGIWTKAVAGARNLCAMAMPMIQMMMARELRGFVPDAELNPIVEENLDLFFRRHVDRERKCVFERVLPRAPV